MNNFYSIQVDANEIRNQNDDSNKKRQDRHINSRSVIE
jgi:hypothetical protein